jgi:hypothetical protein
MKRVSFHFATEYTNRPRDLSPWKLQQVRDTLKAASQPLPKNRLTFGRRASDLTLMAA